MATDPLNPVTILFAEDDDGHAMLVERNLKRAGLINGLTRVVDGQEALEFVRCEGQFSDRVPNGPLIVLLDINMPRVDGIEALRQIKSDPKISHIPVIMLTTTDDPREIDRCYRAGCNVYITKPVEYEAFVEAIRRLGLFLQVVKQPCIPNE
jgi:CheY-like chemotaxis protein